MQRQKQKSSESLECLAEKAEAAQDNFKKDVENRLATEEGGLLRKPEALFFDSHPAGCDGKGGSRRQKEIPILKKVGTSM